MDFVEKQAVHIGYRTLWAHRTQFTIYGYHDILFQFHFLHEGNSHLIGRLASSPEFIRFSSDIKTIGFLGGILEAMIFAI